MAFEGGYTSAVNAQTRRDYERSQIKETQDIADIRRQLFGEKQQEKQEDQLVNNYLMRLMRTLGQPGQDQSQPPSVQASPPGQASQPTPPPMAPPTQGPPPMSPFGPAGGQMNPMLLQASMQRPQIPMMTGGGAPPMAGPPMGAPPAGPAPQGPPPVGPQGAAPAPTAPPTGAVPPQPGWQVGGTADAKLGGGLSSAGMTGPGIMPRQAPSVAQITAEMDKMNIPPNMQYKVLAKAYPMIEAQNKDAMDRLKAQAQIWEAGAKAMEAQRKQQEFEKYGGEPTPDIRNAMFATGGHVPSAQALVGAVEEKKAMPPISAQGAQPSIVPEQDQDKTGEEYLKTLPPSIAKEVQAIAEGRQSIQAMGYRGAQRQQMLERVNQYDPTFDQTQFAARAGVRRDFTSGQAARNITAINTAIGHLGTMNELTAAMANQDMRTINRVVNVMKTEFNDPAINNFELAKTAVSDEMMRVFRQVGASEQEAMRWEKTFAAANTPAVLKGAMQTAVKLLNSRVMALQDQWVNGMGPTIKSPEFVHERSRQVLKDLGVSGSVMGGSSGETSAPNKGDVVKGYRFKGGDPAKQESWEKV